MIEHYYNEIDSFEAAWLRELMKAGVIGYGEIDRRDIREVQAEDLRGFSQCHFFAGIGVWSYALRRAGWPDDSPVWTGSCPCQSFSASGKRRGFSDHRHLWPAWFRLIREYRPDICFGEQVASRDGLAWLDVVSADLEAEGYAIGAADLCAAGFGAPHIRQRLYFVADAADWKQCDQNAQRTERRRTTELGLDSGLSELGHAAGIRLEGAVESSHQQANGQGQVVRTGFTNGFWADTEWLYCRDGKYRAVEPGTFPLVTGTPARVGSLRGYGNALCAPVAQAFIEAYMQHKLSRQSAARGSGSPEDAA